jgi:alpha-ribazole phosphatase
MILHLIRHPRPLIAPGVCYGRLDIPAENAKALAARLRADLPPDLPVWSSPLRRCYDLARLLHAQPVIDGRLVEMDFGNWEGVAWDAIPRHQLDAWAADVADYAPPGGESPLTVQRRALDFVASLAVAEAVVVTHGGVMRLLQAAASGLAIADSLACRPAYGERLTLRFDI